MRKTFFVSVLDQAALSAFNFFLALVLIKYWSDRPEVFGIYSVVLAGSLTLTSVQNALVISHLTVLRPYAQAGGKEDDLLNMFWTANATVMGIAMAVTAVVALAAEGADPALAVTAALFVGATLLREYTRSYNFSMLKVRSVLALDAASLALSIMMIAAVWVFWPPLGLPTLFAILAAAQALASVFAVSPYREHYRLSFAAATRQSYIEIWRKQSKWALLGVVTTEFQQRGYVFVVALFFGTVNVALLQAAALLFRPFQLIVHAWGKLARVVLAGHFAKGHYKEARKFTLRSLVTFLVCYGAFLGVLAAAWPFIREKMFKGHFANVESIIVLWSVATAVTMTAGIFSVEAQSLIKFRELAVGAIYGAIASGIALLAVVALGDFRGSVFAVILGQVIYLISVLRILANSKTGQSGPLQEKELAETGAETCPVDTTQ